MTSVSYLDTIKNNITKLDIGVMVLTYLIRELRDATGMTQKEFANTYGIPLSTLRKWEQGEASPAPYVIELLARTIPSIEKTLMQIAGSDGSVYYYDKSRRVVLDARGNAIRVQENLEKIKMQNLSIYLQDLFEGFYEIQAKFNRDCQYDMKEDIIWTRWK